MTDIYTECMQIIRRQADAYAYGMAITEPDRLDYEIANRISYTVQSKAGWYPLATIYIESVRERAVEPGWGRWKDFPEAEDIADAAADYVADHWADDTGGATEWAIEKFEEIAAERGIVLEPQEEEEAA